MENKPAAQAKPIPCFILSAIFLFFAIGGTSAAFRMGTDLLMLVFSAFFYVGAISLFAYGFLILKLRKKVKEEGAPSAEDEIEENQTVKTEVVMEENECKETSAEPGNSENQPNSTLPPQPGTDGYRRRSPGQTSLFAGIVGLVLEIIYFVFTLRIHLPVFIAALILLIIGAIRTKPNESPKEK